MMKVFVASRTITTTTVSQQTSRRHVLHDRRTAAAASQLSSPTHLPLRLRLQTPPPPPPPNGTARIVQQQQQHYRRRIGSSCADTHIDPRWGGVGGGDRFRCGSQQQPAVVVNTNQIRYNNNYYCYRYSKSIPYSTATTTTTTKDAAEAHNTTPTNTPTTTTTTIVLPHHEQIRLEHITRHDGSPRWHTDGTDTGSTTTTRQQSSSTTSTTTAETDATEEETCISILTLNRPQAANAMGYQMIRELQDCITHLESTLQYNNDNIGDKNPTATSTKNAAAAATTSFTTNNTVSSISSQPHKYPHPNISHKKSRCLIITSCSSTVFSAGADLKERAQMGNDLVQVRDYVTSVRDTFHRMASTIPIPIIAVIEGIAVGPHGGYTGGL
jgi:hypothetical protein